MLSSAFTVPDEYRERIYRQLDECSRYPLFGAFGETGFNKTGLIMGWLEDRGYPCVQLDGRQISRDPEVFHAAARDADSAGASHPLFIVLYGYHYITEDAPFHGELTRLIEQNPAGLRIIIHDRIPPALPLTRLKAHHLYAQIDDSDLAYTEEETGTFFRDCNGLPLRDPDIEELWDLTSGWPAICTLIAEHLKRFPETKAELILAHPFKVIPELSDYIEQEIFAKEPDWLQDFLLQTSLMVELDPAIISEYLDDPDSAKKVSYLEQNRFYTFKNDRGRCQCRRIIRAFLYYKHQQDPATRISDQHCMLAELYQRKRFYIEAFCHAAAGNDYILASSIVQRISDRYQAIQFINLIDGHLEQFSSALHFSATTLFVTRCMPEPTLAEFIPLLKELVLLEERRGNILRLANLQNRLGAIYYVLGYIDSASELFEASIVLARQIEDQALLVCNLQLLADCHLFRGDVDLALKCAREALFIAEENELLVMQIHTLEALSRIALAQKDLRRSAQYLEELASLSEDEPFHSLWLYVDLSDQALQEGKPEEAVRLAGRALSCAFPGSIGYDIAVTNLALGRAYLAMGEYAKAGESLNVSEQSAEYCGFVLYEVLLCKRDLLLSQKKRDEAKELEDRLACLCRKYGYTWSPWYGKPAEEGQNAEVPADGEMLLEIRTMGNFEVLLNHRPVKIKRSSSISLLQFLLVNRGHGVNKEVIIDSIFPSEETEHENHFNVALSTLRKSLEPGLKSGRDSRYILREKRTYLLNEGAIYIDVNELMDICSRIMGQTGEMDPALTSRFNELCRGEFMADYPYDEFLEPERKKVSRVCLDTMRFIAGYYRDSETPARSIEYYERILAAEPYEEASYLDYIDLLLSLQTSHKARDIADQMVRRIEIELDAPVTHQIEEIFRQHGFVYKKTGR